MLGGSARCALLICTSPCRSGTSKAIGGVNYPVGDPSLDDDDARLAKAPPLVPLDVERLEQVGGKPRRLGARVDEDTADRAARPRMRGILQLHDDSERAHVARDGSDADAEYSHRVAGGVNRRERFTSVHSPPDLSAHEGSDSLLLRRAADQRGWSRVGGRPE